MTKPKSFYVCQQCKVEFPNNRKISRSAFCSIECAFWHRVEKTDKCWNWTAATHKFGYGEFRFKSIFYRTHRFSYEMHHGTIPDGMSVLHHCDNPRCVNPDHLYAGTAVENSIDMHSRGRWKLRNPYCGERHHLSRLSANDVLDIRSKLKNGTAIRALAREYGVNQGTIQGIDRGKNWKHLT